MNRMKKQELSEKLSLFVDGMLPEKEAKEIESILEKDQAVRRQVEELRALKGLLASKGALTPHIGFWTRLSIALEEQKREERSLLPFPRKYVPAIVTMLTIVVVFVGVMLVKNRMQFTQFLSEKSQAVKDVYKKNVLQGSLLPIFSKVDKDQALQFSLFGTLSIDKKSETTLRVDENSKKGYWIDVGKDTRSKARSVTLNRFLTAVRPTKEQKKVIDSLLQLTSERIESSVLIGDNNAIAIAPDLPKLNKVMVTSIASCLEPPQRIRFERFLATNDAPYTVASDNAPVVTADRIFQSLPRMKANRYVVITPDTMMYSQVHIDFDSIRQLMSENFGAMERRRNEFIQKIIARNFQRLPRSIPFPQVPPSQNLGDQEFFSVEINVPGGETDQLPMHMIIQRRPSRQVVFPEIQRKPIRIRLWNDSVFIDSSSLP